MDKVLADYLALVETTKANNTFVAYRNSLKNWFPDGKVDLSISYINSVIKTWDNLSRNTKALRCVTLRKFIDFIHRDKPIENYDTLEEMLSSFSAKAVVPECATVEQFKTIYNSCNDIRYKIVIALMFENGLRESEVLNIKTADYDYEQKTIKLVDTKNGNDYLIHLTDRLNNLIKEVADNSEYLIHSRTNKPIHPANLRKTIKNICVTCGYPKLHCHSFRHGSATTLLNNHVDLFVIKEHLRHKSIQSTQRYLHISEQQQKQVQNVFSEIL